MFYKSELGTVTSIVMVAISLLCWGAPFGDRLHAQLASPQPKTSSQPLLALDTLIVPGKRVGAIS